MSETVKFTGRNVPIWVIARVTGKSEHYIRMAIKNKILNIGFAIESNFRTNYYCPDKMVYEVLGFLYDPSEW